MLERFDEAERLLRRADAIREELAGKLWKVGRVDFGAWTHLLAGRPAEAERVLRPAYGSLRRIGERGGALSIHAAMLAQAVFAAGGRDEEAERLAAEAVEVAAATDCPLVQTWTLLTLARVLRLAGRPAEARRAARDALAVAEGKGDLASSSVAQALLDELGSAQPAR
jgi:ATP/maltotriose-dependent transcriptional regulator MalT